MTQVNLRNRSFRRLSQEKQQLYAETLENYHEPDILEPVSEESGCNFIPHHAVHISWKFRIVYDASAEPWKGLSLNKCLHPRPNLLADLMSVLLRFTRRYRKRFSHDRSERRRSKFPKDRLV